MPVNGPPAAVNGGPLVSALRKSGSKDAPSVDEAELLRIAPSSPVSCRGPYDVTDKVTNERFATISLSSELSSNLSVTWQVAVSEAMEPHRALTRSVHVENEASKEWEVSVRDGNGTTVYQYAYQRFNPAQGAQRMNVTDDKGAIVAVIEYVSRAELRVFTCTDSVSPLVTGQDAGNASRPSPAPQAAGAGAPALLQRRAEPAEPSPEAKPRGPQFKGPCNHPLETARLTQSWGDSAGHAWTLQRFRDAKHPPPPPAALKQARFAEVGSLAAATAAARRFAGGSYDVLLLLELSALVSHSEAPWCLAVTSAYVVITASVVLLGGVAAVQLLSRPRPRRRRRRKGRARKSPPGSGSAAGSAGKSRPASAAGAGGASGAGAGKKSR